MDTEKLNAWNSLLEKIAGLVALLCLTAVMIFAIDHFTSDQIRGMLENGRGAAIFSVSLLSAITLIVMLLNARLKSTLTKVLLVLVGALAGLLGQPTTSPTYTEDEPAVTSQTVLAVRTHHSSPASWLAAR